jgi:hypothetical protein
MTMPTPHGTANRSHILKMPGPDLTRWWLRGSSQTAPRGRNSGATRRPSPSGDGKGTMHLIKPSRKRPLAEMIGTTRSRVNFFMNKFKKLGFIEYNGGLKVNHSLLTVIVHD